MKKLLVIICSLSTFASCSKNASNNQQPVINLSAPTDRQVYNVGESTARTIDNGQWTVDNGQ